MKIAEIITESQELEEGWKQKLAGAALAGAAALGGGGAHSQPVDWWGQQDPEFYTQQHTSPKASQQNSIIKINDVGDMINLAQVLASLDSINDFNITPPNKHEIYNNVRSIFAYNFNRLDDRKKRQVMNYYNVSFEHQNKILSGSLKHKEPRERQLAEIPKQFDYANDFLKQIAAKAKQAEVPQAQPQQQAIKLSPGNVINMIHAGKITKANARDADLLLNQIIESNLNKKIFDAAPFFAKADLFLRHPELNTDSKNLATRYYNMAQKFSPGLPDEDKKIVKQVHDILSSK